MMFSTGLLGHFENADVEIPSQRHRNRCGTAFPILKEPAWTPAQDEFVRPIYSMSLVMSNQTLCTALCDEPLSPGRCTSRPVARRSDRRVGAYPRPCRRGKGSCVSDTRKSAAPPCVRIGWFAPVPHNAMGAVGYAIQIAGERRLRNVDDFGVDQSVHSPRCRPSPKTHIERILVDVHKRLQGQRWCNRHLIDFRRRQFQRQTVINRPINVLVVNMEDPLCFCRITVFSLFPTGRGPSCRPACEPGTRPIGSSPCRETSV
jgi:hypothetical protein